MTGKSLFQVGEEVEFWRVLAHLSLLAICLLVFGEILHRVELRLMRHDKYHQMLKKAYSELMILGLISLVLKLLKELTTIDSYSKTMLAFQVADLIIFSLAIALILQAICIFLQLRKHSRRADQAELTTTKYLIDQLHIQNNNGSSDESSKETYSWFCGNKRARGEVIDKGILKYRLLRHLFLSHFSLPQLFPFSKYIRRAQANEISYMIEVKPSMWLLLLVVAWGICGFASILEKFEFKLDLVKVLVTSAWILVLVQILVAIYIRSRVNQLLVLAGYSANKTRLGTKLEEVADEEVRAWKHEFAENPLDVMDEVHKKQDEMEHKQQTGRNSLSGDMCLQLITTYFSNTPRIYSPENLLESQTTRVEPESLGIHFPRKGWHAVVTFLMILNGLFVALFLQCALYKMDEIYIELGLIAAIMVPLPMMLNTLVLQQRIFRDSVLVYSIVHLDATILGEAIADFRDVIEHQTEFATSLLQSLKTREFSIDELERAMKSTDANGTGFIQVDTVCSLLASFGHDITRFRFNSMVKLLFELDGTRVKYKQLIKLLTLVGAELGDIDQCGAEYPRSSVSFEDDRGREGVHHDTFASTRPLSLLAQSSVASDVASSDFAYAKASTPTLCRVLTRDRGSKKEIQPRCAMLQRSYTYQFARSSSRVLHSMYYIQNLAHSHEDSASDDTVTV